MIYQFEYEGFNVCGDCPCWCPDIISEGYATAEGCCYINFEKRNRFTEKPIDCPLLIVSKADKEIGKESLQALLAAEKRKIVRCNKCKHVNYSGCGGKTVYCKKTNAICKRIATAHTAKEWRTSHADDIFGSPVRR